MSVLAGWPTSGSTLGYKKPRIGSFAAKSRSISIGRFWISRAQFARRGTHVVPRVRLLGVARPGSHNLTRRRARLHDPAKAWRGVFRGRNCAAARLLPRTTRASLVLSSACIFVLAMPLVSPPSPFLHHKYGLAQCFTQTHICAFVHLRVMPASSSSSLVRASI